MIENILIFFGAIFIILVVCFLVFVLDHFKQFSRHDNNLIESFLKKFPDVSPDFYAKSWREQSAENNQEIHDLNEKYKGIDDKVDNINNLQKQIAFQLKNLNIQQSMALDELRKNEN